MQLVVHIGVDEPLSLPINYNHILQAVIYRSLGNMPEYATFLHDGGFARGQRQYKMFQFSQLKGEYRIENKRITFFSEVSFEVRSPEPLLIRLLGDCIWENGVTFGDHVYTEVQLELYDYTVEEKELLIRMKSPLTVYATDEESEKTFYFSPDDPVFYDMVNDNFFRKYQAYYGITPVSGIRLEAYGNKFPKKLVTRYKGILITAWYGTYQLTGERKYLDFLYQTGLGAKNAQGFGMFEIL